MPSFYKSALLMASALLSARSVSAQTTTAVTPMESAPVEPPIVNTPSYVGCFKSSTPLDDYGPSRGQSRGICQRICVYVNKAVFAEVDGLNCFCGDLLPANDTRVPDSECDTKCEGYDLETCGGPSRWWVGLTAITKNRIEYYDPASVSSAVTTSKPTSPPETTIIISETATSAPSEKSKPNTAGIVAGAVVGVVVLVALIGGVFLFLRQRKRRELEAEHQRQAAVNQFIFGGKHGSQSSMSDSRLDPEIMHRRQSDGSIADNQDYSRRILQVTNPDGY